MWQQPSACHFSVCDLDPGRDARRHYWFRAQQGCPTAGSQSLALRFSKGGSNCSLCSERTCSLVLRYRHISPYIHETWEQGVLKSGFVRRKSARLDAPFEDDVGIVEQWEPLGRILARSAGAVFAKRCCAGATATRFFIESASRVTNYTERSAKSINRPIPIEPPHPTSLSRHAIVIKSVRWLLPLSKPRRRGLNSRRWC